MGGFSGGSPWTASARPAHTDSCEPVIAPPYKKSMLTGGAVPARSTRDRTHSHASAAASRHKPSINRRTFGPRPSSGVSASASSRTTRRTSASSSRSSASDMPVVRSPPFIVRKL